MDKYDKQYLVSRGEEDDEYGLYVIKNDVVDKSTGRKVAYFYDGDEFIVISNEQIKYFIKPSDLSSCKDEYNDAYTGEALKERIEDAIREYELNIDRYLEVLEDMHQKFLEGEAKDREID